MLCMLSVNIFPEPAFRSPPCHSSKVESADLPPPPPPFQIPPAAAAAADGSQHTHRTVIPSDVPARGLSGAGARRGGVWGGGRWRWGGGGEFAARGRHCPPRNRRRGLAPSATGARTHTHTRTHTSLCTFGELPGIGSNQTLLIAQPTVGLEASWQPVDGWRVPRTQGSWGARLWLGERERERGPFAGQDEKGSKTVTPQGWPWPAEPWGRVWKGEVIGASRLPPPFLFARWFLEKWRETGWLPVAAAAPCCCCSRRERRERDRQASVASARQSWERLPDQLCDRQPASVYPPLHLFYTHRGK